MKITTPYYLLDEKKLLKNLLVIKKIREVSGAKFVLALKCFSMWSVFPLMRKYLDGTTSSGLYEARLGKEKFGKEVHAYSVAYSRHELKEVIRYADKIIFNSTSQLQSFLPLVKKMNIGIRVNPGFSYSHYDLANPARRYCRLGVNNKAELFNFSRFLKGLMFHFNCENNDFNAFAKFLEKIKIHYGDFLKKMEWISLGGGIAFTSEGYPINDFCQCLKDFAETLKIQIYLEPGDAAVTNSAELVTTVLDIVRNEKPIAIVDASIEAHMLDHLVYRTSPRLAFPKSGKCEMIIAGRSCLAGDVFGTYKLEKPLKKGSIVRFADAAGYTMVKKNWFNGLPMPAICLKKMNGKKCIIKSFFYEDYINSLS